MLWKLLNIMSVCIKERIKAVCINFINTINSLCTYCSYAVTLLYCTI